MKKIKEYLSKKEYIVFIIALIITISSFSYAFFISSDILGNNVATTECFKLTLEDSNDINLDKAYPLSESEGETLTPYQFTIKNVCNNQADYQVNIETLNTSTIDTEYLRIKLDNNESNILKRYELNESNINNNVKEGRKITSGTLRANEEKTYSLRMWIDEESTKEQTANKEYHGKVTVIATPNKEVHDIEIAYIVDGVPQDVPPAKGTGYKLKEINCEGANGRWDRINWELILGNWTGKAKCDLEFEIATSANVTLYGAPNAVISYTDTTGFHTHTLDSTGKKEDVEIGIMDDIVFTDTTISKNPDNLSENYTKTITINDETIEVYVMPDNSLYWYGYKDSNLEDLSSTNGWVASPNLFAPPIYNENSITLPGHNSGWYACGVGVKNAVEATKVNSILKGNSAYQGVYGWLGGQSTKNFTSSREYMEITSNALAKYSKTFSTHENGYYPSVSDSLGNNMVVYAFWYE